MRKNVTERVDIATEQGRGIAVMSSVDESRKLEHKDRFSGACYLMYVVSDITVCNEY